MHIYKSYFFIIYVKIGLQICLQITCLIYMRKQDLELNNQQRLICHKAKPNKKAIIISYLKRYYCMNYQTPCWRGL